MEEKVKRTVSMLDNSETILRELDRILSEYNIYPGEQTNSLLKEIKKMRDKVKFYSNKLKKDELEVAFAGVEKAGKSTFVNAFIGRDLLPTASERATYTVTEVRYSEKGRVEVSFFSEDEFNEQILRGLLRKVKYKDVESVTLRNFSLKSLEEHEHFLKNENPEVYQAERVKSLKDLREILEGKNEILNLLDSGTRIFEEQDVNFKPFIVDKHKSRAVKRVVIYSPELKGLENIVIYDLPGFDSPTFIHSKFTVESLKRVDAVVVVRDARKPSLTGPEVEIITETYEEDGVALKEKAFFFLNRVDELKTKEKVNEVREKFIEELKRNGLFKDESRIIMGASLAHLAKAGIVNSEDAKISLEDLERLGLDTGIKAVKDSLTEYNRTERRKILFRRINAIKAKLVEMLNHIEEDLKQKIKEEDFHNQYLMLGFETLNKAKLQLKEALSRLSHEYKTKVFSNTYISREIKSQIDNLQFLPSEEYIEKIKLKVETVSPTMEQRPDAFNKELREHIRQNLRRQFIKLSKGTLEEFIKEFREKVVLEFMKAFDIYSDNEKVKEKINEFLQGNVGEVLNEIAGFNMLIVRFSGNIIDLLMIPLSSRDRINKFNAISSEIYSLYAFYDFFDPDIAPKTSHFVSMILEQKMPPDVKKIEESTDKVIDRFANAMDIDIDKSFLKPQLLKIFINSDNRLDDLLEIVDDKEDLNDLIGQILNAAQYVDPKIAIVNRIRKFLSSKEQKEEFKPKSPTNYDEVIQEIQKDAEILKYLFKRAVIGAIGFEKAFMNFITDYVNLIIENILSENSNELAKFLVANFEILCPDKVESIKEKEVISNKLSEIREKVTNLRNLITQVEG